MTAISPLTTRQFQSMETYNTSEARRPWSHLPETTALLVAHLSRHEALALAELLGPSIMELLSKKLLPSATNPKGLAYFLVRVYGDHEVLLRPDIRALLLSKLSQEEATGLCRVPSV